MTSKPAPDNFSQTNSAFALQWEETTPKQVIEILVKEQYVGVIQLAYYLLGDEKMADDFAVQTLVTAARDRYQYQGQISPKAWVYSILLQSVPYKANKWPLSPLSKQIFKHSINLSKSSSPPLSKDQLLSIYLHLVDQMSPEEIAYALGTHQKNVEEYILRLVDFLELDLEREIQKHSFNGTSFTEPISEYQLQKISETVFKKHESLSRPKSKISKELTWVGMVLASIFFLFALYNSQDISKAGQSLFPTPTNPPPTPIAVEPTHYIKFSDIQDSVWTEQMLLQGHLDRVNNLAFSPTGNLLASASTDASIRLWETSKGFFLYALEGYQSEITDITFAPRNSTFESEFQPSEGGQNLLASGSSDGTVILWRLSTSQGFPWIVLEGHSGPISDLVFSPSGELLVVAAEGGVWLWEIETELARLVQQYPEEKTHHIAISPNEKWLAVAPSKSPIRVRTIPDGEVVLQLDAHERDVSSLVFSNDNRYLISGGDDLYVNIWELTPISNDKLSAKLTQTIQQDAPIKEIISAPDKSYLGMLYKEGGLEIWDLDGKTQVLSPFLHLSSTPFSFAFAPEGNQIASGTISGLVYLMYTSENTIVPKGNFRFFIHQPFDEYPEQRVLLIDPQGKTFDPTTPLDERYSLSNREFSSLTGLYVQVPDVIPDEAVYLGQINSSIRIVSLLYDYPSNGYQNIQITVHVPTGFGDGLAKPNDFPDRRVGSSAMVEIIQIGNSELSVSGEYTEGGWELFPEQEAIVSEEDRWSVVNYKVRWLNETTRAMLRWQYKKTLFELRVAPKEGVEMVESAKLLTKQDLIEIASQMLR